MAITFPRDFPSLCRITGDVPFWLQPMQSRGLAGGGSPQVADIGPMLWRGRWRIQLSTAAEAGAWSAWASSLRGGLRTFKGRPRRRWPLSRPRGFTGLTVPAGGPFSGAGNLASIGALRDTVTLSLLPVGLVLQPGDHFSIPVGPRQHLHRVTEGATVAAGGGVTLSVMPPLHQAAATGVAVLFEAPWCDMVAVSAPDESLSLIGGTVSFEGQQVLI